MFTQSYGTSYFRHSTGKCTPEGFQLIKPDKSNNGLVTQYQSTWVDAMLYYCIGMVDRNYDCSPIMSSSPLNAWPNMLDVSSADYWLTMPKITGESIGEWSEVFFGTKLPNEIMNEQVREYYEGLECSISPNGARWFDIKPNWSYLRPNIARVTKETLHLACEATGVLEQSVLVMVNADPFLDKLYGRIPQTPNPTNSLCDHWVVLTSCDIDNNEYHFLSWASEITLPLEVLVATTVAPWFAGSDGSSDKTLIGGSICAFMSVAPAKGIQKALEPVKCNPDVCNQFCQAKV